MDKYDYIISKIGVFPDFWRILNGDFFPDISLNLKKADTKTLMQIKFSEGKPMSYYCSKVELEHGSFTYIADKLENKGLLERVHIDGDRRKKILKLTEEGRIFSDEIHSQFCRHLSEKLNLLNDREIDELVQALKILSKLEMSLRSK